MESRFTREEFELLKDFLPCREYTTKNANKPRKEYLYFSDEGTHIWDIWEKLSPGYMKEDFSTKEDYKVHAFLEKPLEDMPLFVNDQNWSALAKWRLFLGR